MPAWFSFTAGELAWWVLIVMIVIVAVIAIVFAILAFGESQVLKPYRNIVRHDIIAKGDLVVDGDAKIDEMDVETLQVHKGATFNKLKASSLRLNDVVVISDEAKDKSIGPISVQLSANNSAYRVDSLQGSTIDLILPPASEAPGQLFQIMKSQIGSQAVVNVLVATGDFLCDKTAGCIPAALGPSISLLPNQADQIWITNDFANSWKRI